MLLTLTNKLLTISAVVASLVLSSSVIAKDWTKQSSWSSSSMQCGEMQKNMRTYYNGGGYKSKRIGVTYCNSGAYVIKKVRMKITRQSDNAVIFKDDKGQNLTAGYGHYFLIESGLTNKGETFKMELQYNIATGDTKRCKREFVYDNTDVMWMVESKGTKLNGNSCKGITFKKK